MKRIFFTIIIGLTFLGYSNAQDLTSNQQPDSLIENAKSLEASFNYGYYFSPTDGSYIETYLSVFGHSVVFASNDNGIMQASIEVTFLFKQDSIIVDFRKYNLLSPEVDVISVIDTLGNPNYASAPLPNFVDMQRIPLPLGKYVFELIIKDNYSDSPAFRYETDLDIKFDKSKIEISSIQMIEKFTPTQKENVLSKSGYDLVPYISDFYPENINEITFYTELYNSNKVFQEGETYLLKSYIESYETKKSLYNFNKFTKQKARDVNIQLSTFKIDELPSGNYNLVVEVRNRDNELMSNKKTFFQRSNPKGHVFIKDISTIGIENTFIANEYNRDTLVEYLKCLYPISDITERRYAENIQKLDSIRLMKQLFYNFWSSRDVSDPEGAWKKYKSKVYKTNMSYTTFIKKGYETDRGRVFLQYGVPNTIREEKNCGSAYPFEIWHYYHLEGEMDYIFLFYNPEIVNDDYILLHSNVLGELINKDWVSKLYRDKGDAVEITIDYDRTDYSDGDYGCDAIGIWRNP